MPQTEPRRQQRDAFVRARCHANPDALVRASEDAGMRSYWRLPGHGVLMDAPPAANDLNAWLAMQALLHKGGVRVPRVRVRDPECGFLLLEDLGQCTLLDCLTATTADGLFQQAITQLVALQAIAPPAGAPVYDADLLGQELDLFSDWFVARELGVTLNSTQARVWQGARRFLVQQALAQPRVLVHRDFMPRNLMPVDGALAVIDFQDAVIGPVTYDPLCLFKDAFIDWPEPRVRGWLRQYHEAASRAQVALPEWPRFCRDVDLIGVQRHLKVIGIFARLKHRDAKGHYLVDAPRFMGYLQAVLPRYPELEALRALLTDLWTLWQRQASA